MAIVALSPYMTLIEHIYAWDLTILKQICAKALREFSAQ